MEITKQKLERLESILKDKNAPILKHLNPGIPQEEVVTFFQSHNIKAIPALITLYEWHNGVKNIYGISDSILELLPFGKLFNLDEMIYMRKVFKEWAEEDFEDLDNYIPFLGSGESDMLLLNLTTKEILGYKPMIQIVGDLEFHSIDSMLDCIIECFENGAFTIDQKKGLEIDFKNYRKIQEKHLKLKIE